MKSAPLDVTALRKDFPMFSQAGAQPLAYLDTASSSQTPEPVLKAMDEYYRTCRANVHRGMYRASEVASEKFEAVRRTVADFIGGWQSADQGRIYALTAESEKNQGRTPETAAKPTGEGDKPLGTKDGNYRFRTKLGNYRPFRHRGGLNRTAPIGTKRIANEAKEVADGR